RPAACGSAGASSSPATSAPVCRRASTPAARRRCTRGRPGALGRGWPPDRPARAAYRTRAAAGSRLQTRPGPAPSSIELPQVHARVERGDLGVPVEHQGLPPQELPDAPLPGLGPARMIHVRVHVCVEPVLAWRILRPGGGRLRFLKTDADQALRGLESV